MLPPPEEEFDSEITVEVIDIDENDINGDALVTDIKNKNKTKNKNNNYDEDFEMFWNEYPRRVGKTAAFNKFKSVIKNEDVTAEELAYAAQRYSHECKRNKTEEKYIKHASTFLGPNRHYEDYLPESEPTPIEMIEAEELVPEILTDVELEEMGYI